MNTKHDLRQTSFKYAQSFAVIFMLSENQKFPEATFSLPWGEKFFEDVRKLKGHIFFTSSRHVNT